MIKSLLLMLSLLPACAVAVNPLDLDDQQIVYSETFLNAHPDLKYRTVGMENYAKGRYREALHYFRLGAYYADKPSQGMVAQMLWQGEGTAVDRPAAYVNGPNGTPIRISGDSYYQDKFWKMDDYLEWQSTTWQALPTGTATTGELVPVRDDGGP